MSAIGLSRMNRRHPPRRERTGILEGLRRLDDDPILWCGCDSRAGAAECHDEYRSEGAAVLRAAAA